MLNYNIEMVQKINNYVIEYKQKRLWKKIKKHQR